MRITDQVIEEVDEQMTITSQRPQEIRPTAQSLFQGTATTEPVDVPTTSNRTSNDYMRTQSFAVNHHEPFIFPMSPDYISSSAPAAQYHVVTPTGDMYDIKIEDFDQSQRGSRASIVTNPAGGGSYYFAKIYIMTHKSVMFYCLDAKTEAGENTGRMGADEHFEKLRQAREKERLNRRINRSVSTQPANDTELLLDQPSTRNDELSLSLGGNISPASATTTFSNSNTNL